MRVLVVLVALTLPTGAAGQQVADPEASSRAEHVQSLRARIAGREQEPAGQVFENIRILRDVPAARLLAIMNMGYGRSLGVGCEYCHNPANWASDENDKKEIARGMMAMAARINEELLPSIANLAERPIVNCTTCHRGQTKPATNMEQ